MENANSAVNQRQDDNTPQSPKASNLSSNSDANHADSNHNANLAAVKVEHWNHLTVLQDMIWQVQEESNSDEAAAVNVHLEDQAPIAKASAQPTEEEIQQLLEGITEDNLVWSHSPAAILSQQQPPLVTLNLPTPAATKIPMAKESTCELELDIHENMILNRLMPRLEFGAELWEEERLRCQAKGLAPDQVPTPPATQTVYRPMSESENDYQMRFEKLQKKGFALRKAAQHAIQHRQHQERETSSSMSSHLLRLESLSQFAGHQHENVEPDEDEEEEEAHSLQQHENEHNYRVFDPDSWASQAIDDTLKEAELQEEIMLSLMENNNTDSIVEEYTRTQSSQPPLQQQEIPPPISQTVPLISIVQQEAIEEQEEHEQESQRELEDILTSTQYDAIDDSDLYPIALDDNNRKRAKQKINLSSASAAATSEEEAEQQQASQQPLLYRRPSSLDRFDSPLHRRDHDSPPSSSLTALPVSASTLATPPLARNSSNRLTSAFRKRKLSSDSPTMQFPASSSSSPSFLQQQNQQDDSLHQSLSIISPPPPSSSHKKAKKSVSFTAERNQSDTVDDYSHVLSSSRSLGIAFRDDNEQEQAQVSSGEVEGNTKWEEPSLPPAANNYSTKLWLSPTFSPPSYHDTTDMSKFNLPQVINTPAFCSKEEDAKSMSDHGKSSGYISYMMTQHPVHYQHDLPHFDSIRQLHNSDNAVYPILRCLLPTFTAPRLANDDPMITSSTAAEESSKSEKHDFHDSNTNRKSKNKKLDKSQICTPTQTLSPAHTSSLLTSPTRVGMGDRTQERMTRLITLSMELYCNTRKDLLPNPRYDAIQMIAWCASDVMTNAEAEIVHHFHGLICWVPPTQQLNEQSEEGFSKQARQWKTNVKTTPNLPMDIQIDILHTEQELFHRFFDLNRTLDPDFLIGYENQNQSYGYFIKRGIVLGIDCLKSLSRLPDEKPSFRNASVKEEAASHHKSNDQYNEDMVDDGDPGIFIKGRTILNAWQLMKAELKLSNNTIQFITEEVLKMRLPSFTHAQLTRWYQHPKRRYQTVHYLFTLASLNLLLIEKLDLIRKISESARLSGIDFYSVMHRGSQYRVEAALLLKSRALNYLLISPSRQKVANQAPMEVIPLVMEPKSQFYHDPVLVLDFQSLYPSMMITHNLCYSTCMGKLRSGQSGEEDTTGKLGVIAYPEKIAAANAVHSATSGSSSSTASQQPYVSPNGSVFCAKAVRHGILPMMVKEMLSTRIMIKRAMKRHLQGNNKASTGVLAKVMDARQLAIKLLANVTYGYTAAGFSGRMPMAELADAIVQSGRSLLEWTVQVINTHATWRAHVVYGDTDSVFVHLPGRNLQQAFAIGEEIAREITSKTSDDVVLKFEKVYHPCILVTKKRYVGHCYESITQKVAHLDAKGIEVVRRDQCPATIKMQEKVLRILFNTKDMSLVRECLNAQWSKMLMGSDRVLLKDFIFRKEVRFGHYASVSSQPPGAIVATKAVLTDEMAVPPYNWRVPYIVVHGLPNAALKNLVFDPCEVMRRGSNLRINFIYYITKCINPALDRVLSLCGVSVAVWYKSFLRPKPRLRHINYDLYLPSQDQMNNRGDIVNNKRKQYQMTMDQFTTQASCELCAEDALPQRNICQRCLDNHMESLITLTQRLGLAQHRDKELELLCQICCGAAQPARLFQRGELISSDACSALECPVFHERTRLIARIEDFELACKDIFSEDATSTAPIRK